METGQNTDILQDSVRLSTLATLATYLTDLPAIILTTWHLAFASLMTQILARTTTLLDSRKTVKMTGRVYLRAIVPIGFFFSLSLICGNKAYLYLSVAFIQMLKVRYPLIRERLTQAYRVKRPLHLLLCYSLPGLWVLLLQISRRWEMSPLLSLVSFLPHLGRSCLT